MRIPLLLSVVALHVISFNNAMGLAEQTFDALAVVTRSINSFSNNFSKAVAEDQSENYICSSIIAWMALLMATYGARERTESTLRSALELPSENDDAIKKETQELRLNFLRFHDVTLMLGIKIFVANNFQPKADFLAMTADVFVSHSELVDFGNAVQASKTINDWCQAKTNKRIKDLIKPDNFSSDTSLVLVNAVHFEGNWMNKFDAAETKPRPFHINQSTTKDIPTMFRSGSYRYSELPEVKAKFIVLPYKSPNMLNVMSMIIILPDEIEGLAELEKNLDKVAVDKLLRGNTRDVNVYLPKFKIESTLNLQGPLGKLGLGDMFTDKANFSGIIDSSPLKVSEVVQKAFIEVNEEGNEAAAATAFESEYKMGGKPVPLPIIEFVVDRPFICMIVTETGDLRFTLLAVNPTS